jgi:hypothetical protein
LHVRTGGLFATLLCCLFGAAWAGEEAPYKPLRLEGNPVRWQPAAASESIVVSYSLVTQELTVPGARNCRRLAPLDALLSASGIAREAARAEIAAAFAMWEAAASISFREAAEPGRADILIGAQAEPEGWAFADVFYDVRSREAVKPISRSLICLNPARHWKVGFDGDLQRYDLRYTLAHEIGHAIGLDHPSGAGQIMGYRYEERFRELQAGDISGAIELYGRRPAESISASAGEPAAVPAPRSPHTRRLGTRAFTAR